MNELYVTLMSWAVTLSGYAAPAHLPEVVRVPHAYFVEHACGGRECKVMGWYAGEERVFIDERLDPQDNLLHSSILMHEFVHYLQRHSGHYETAFSCANAIAMEREAYAAQSAYLVRYGVYQPVGASLHSVGCEAHAE